MAAKKEPERRSVERRAPPKAAPKAAKPSVFNNNALNNTARADISPDELRKLISEAAYYRAKKRGFAPGHELEDWIQAEAEVMNRLGAPGRPS
jgi:Protein of unknown function (DUF2934)